MPLSSELRIVEVAPVYLTPPHSGRRAAPGLTALLERLEIAGMKFIALGQHDGERCSLSTSERVSGYRGANGGTGPIQLIGEYEPDCRATEGTSTQRLSALTIDVTGSDGFARAVYGMRAADHLARCFAQVGPALDRGLVVRARINVAYGCPYQGNVDGDDVAALAATLHAHGCTEIVLADTLGIAVPPDATALVRKVAAQIPETSIAVRFHDTYGLALTNIYSCLAAGITSVESSLGGVYVEAQGNYLQTPVCTEDVVNMLHGLNISTGIDLPALVAASHFIAQELGRAPISKTSSAFHAVGCRI